MVEDCSFIMAVKIIINPIINKHTVVIITILIIIIMVMDINRINIRIIILSPNSIIGWIKIIITNIIHKINTSKIMFIMDLTILILTKIIIRVTTIGIQIILKIMYKIITFRIIGIQIILKIIYKIIIQIKITI